MRTTLSMLLLKGLGSMTPGKVLKIVIFSVLLRLNLEVLLMEEAVKFMVGGSVATPFTPFWISPYNTPLCRHGSRDRQQTTAAVLLWCGPRAPTIHRYADMAAETGNRPLRLYYYGAVQGCDHRSVLNRNSVSWFQYCNYET